MFAVFGTDTYVREIAKWAKDEQMAVERLPAQLAKNPFVGRPLNYPFLREKRIRGKRAYFLVYADLRLVLLVATSAKKDQEATIESIREHLDEFREVAIQASLL